MTNIYKTAWMESSGQGSAIRTTSSSRKRISKKQNKTRSNYSRLVNVARQQAIEQAVVSSAYAISRTAAQSQVAGRLGIGLRIGGKIGVRAVPVVGAVLLAKDIYDLTRYLTQ